MEFQFSERLKNYIQKTGKQFILVEVVTADTSDIEISEIAVRFVSRRIADHYIRDRHFIEKQTEVCSLLLPRYPLRYADMVELDLRSFLFIHLLKQKGMSI
ncbi:MAG: hypothetical protein IJ061_08415 [Lachnospiraceae bacterium]|nr:hypothetical protein [Lachnospiraceae bacterium]